MISQILFYFTIHSTSGKIFKICPATKPKYYDNTISMDISNFVLLHCMYNVSVLCCIILKLSIRSLITPHTSHLSVYIFNAFKYFIRLVVSADYLIYETKNSQFFFFGAANMKG